MKNGIEKRGEKRGKKDEELKNWARFEPRRGDVTEKKVYTRGIDRNQSSQAKRSTEKWREILTLYT